ncbi:LAME_0A06876g1_1 [Lachancea meyersii CBS 8951]|uniref:LAME_0A06876g1_1 n=1 Tax=Lachancea meyersii CBS 8951 TaxID=1266667 RepID=A0A1G4IQN6_9SACH|nr:LAME_0A06876g1_1 [Lachancea meyersii CBS 8951]
MRLIARQCRAFRMQRFLYNDSQAAKVANLGDMTEYLSSEAIPHLLNKPMCSERLDPQISLRLFPTNYAYLPRVHGLASYRNAMSLLTSIVRSFVLHQNCSLHVTGVETISGISKGQRYNMITGNDKIVIHWRSCRSEGENLDSETGFFPQAKLKDLDSVKSSSGSTTETTDTTTASSDRELLNHLLNSSHKALRGLNPHPATILSELTSQLRYPRIIHGLFIFELNHDNTKVLVHTIDNVEISGKRKKQETGALAC